MMRINPEIRRNLWLEFSLHRAIAMPAALMVILYIASQTHWGSGASELGSAAIWAFYVLVKLWGGYKAADSVLDEVNDNTWDFQKLSALSPWSLTFGKLFGSTAYCWYGGMIAFAAAVLSSISISPFGKVCIGGALLLLGGLIVQATALFSSLLAIQGRISTRNKLRSLPHLLIGLFLGSFFAPSSILNWWKGSQAANAINLTTITWYGNTFDRLNFYTVLAAVVVAWLIVGIYWQMRGQMKMRTWPWLWLGFVIFLIGLFSGFKLPEIIMLKIGIIGDVMAFIIGMICLYVIAFQETWNIVRYRRMVTAWKDLNYERAIEICPRWILTWSICLAVAVYISVSNASANVMEFMAAWLCFAMRDIAILHLFKLFPASRRPHMTAIFYMGVLYIIMPFLFKVFHAKDLIGVWVPWPFGDDQGYILQGLISGAVQAGIAVLLVVWRCRRAGKALA